MHNTCIIRVLILSLAFCTLASAGERNLLHRPEGHDLLISVNPSLHQQYGLSYPVTFIAQFSTDDVGLQAFVRYDTVSAWTALPERLETDLFNGIDAVRFDYATRTAYVSATFADASDDIYIRITEPEGENVALTFGGIAPYYDNRRGVVVIGIDDWKDYTDALFIHMASILRSFNLPYTAAVITGETTDSTWAHIQAELDAGSFEAATHSRTHPRSPDGDVVSEVGGSYTDLRDNLILPAQYRKGNTEYVYSYIVPFGESSPEIEEEITRSGYLIGRLVGSQNGLYTAWDTSAGRFFSDGTTKEMGPPWGVTDATELNGAFDSRMAQNRIYHLLMHPNSLDATDEWSKPYFSEHLTYISNRTDVWYTTYGHLYVYRLLGDSTVGQTVWPEAPPTITTQPVSSVLVIGATASFSCGAQGTPPLTYQWQRDGMDIPGADRSSYSPGYVTMADSGSTFRCIVRNSHGSSASEAATLTVVPDHTGSGIVSDDFNTEALNTSLWHFVDPLHDVSLGLTGGGTENARLALTIPAGSVHDIWTEGNTAPRIMQACANSDLEIEARFDAPMSASTQIQGVLVEQDSLNYIRFDFVCDPPRLGFFAATFTNGQPTEQVDMTVDLEAPYRIRVQRVGDLWTGLYSSDGVTWTEATSFTHELTVQQVGAWAGNAGDPAPAFTGLIDYFFNSLSPVPDEDGPDVRLRPVITTDPVTVTVLEGQPASFTVAVSSTTPITYRWQKNGTDITGATGTTYALAAAARSDSGAAYRCIVSNVAGRDTSAAAHLIVLPLIPAVIYREPIDTTVSAGQPVNFTVAATGTAPLTYRWQRDGVDIPEVNDSLYCIASAAPTDSGVEFRCIVSNIGGCDTSVAVHLLVVTEPVPTGIRLSPVVLLQGAMEGDSMRTLLLTRGLLPLDHPFTGAGWGSVPCDSVVMMPDGTVDWVLIELRRGTADSTVQARKAGLLRNTGAVTETDGISPLHFPTVLPGDYFIVVRHRNHLPVMSATPVGLGSTVVNFDFTTAAAQCSGSDVALLAGGRYAMVAGNADGNGGIGATDLAFIRLNVGAALGYALADVDLNGTVGTEDILLTRTNIGRITAVP